jgi:hypothetical protein
VAPHLARYSYRTALCDWQQHAECAGAGGHKRRNAPTTAISYSYDVTVPSVQFKRTALSPNKCFQGTSDWSRALLRMLMSKTIGLALPHSHLLLFTHAHIAPASAFRNIIFNVTDAASGKAVTDRLCLGAVYTVAVSTFVDTCTCITCNLVLQHMPVTKLFWGLGNIYVPQYKYEKLQWKHFLKALRHRKDQHLS